MNSGNGISAYVPRRNSESTFIGVRGLRYHVRKWPGDAGQSGLPPLLMLHGFMDVAASFQFVVDCLPIERTVYAIDWRGFGLTDSPNVDSYCLPIIWVISMPSSMPCRPQRLWIYWATAWAAISS